ncbi:MAG: LemA family protein [Phycisphaerae bacterium]|nr:LemA family protein [Phycisphaerae bacterium]
MALLFLALVFAGVTLVGGYNHAVRMDEQVKGAWSQVENQLQRRYDLVPNLVEAVRGFATHEREIFTDVAEARTRYFSAAHSGSREQQVEAANGLERALSRLLVLQERYPELKAQESFLRLQDELAGTENRLAYARQQYNEVVNALNAYRRSFFGRFAAGLAGVGEARYFEPPKAAHDAPRVSFEREGAPKRGE